MSIILFGFFSTTGNLTVKCERDMRTCVQYCTQTVDYPVGTWTKITPSHGSNSSGSTTGKHIGYHHIITQLTPLPAPAVIYHN
ncbi:hypothetical protein OUZ56_020796 [Daphnia magna]|uniref:Secreted protein n=1 Tax=Daphnia magna TaxID=35525 RepID=A0ABQ9ZG66_9CRUS|nr:hypothetical protein OUZ56_020796 [Daphnia magna]